MRPMYLARIEDLGRGDFVKVDCAACRHVALRTPNFLLRLGLSPAAKVLDLKGAGPVPWLWSERACHCVGEVGTPERVADPSPGAAVTPRQG